MICIYEKTTSDYNNNGLGTLEPIECTFKPVINGVWSLEMTLPYDAEGKSQLIANDRILKVTDIDCISEQTAQYQLFRIYDCKKEDNFISVIAYPIGLDARFDTFVDSVKMNYKTASQAIAQMNGLSSKYTVSGSGYDATVKSAEYANANLISILNGDNGFVQVWDGEICYDNYNIRVNHRLGSSSNPLDVRYGKNITGMSYDMDASNIITQLYPKSKDGYPLDVSGGYNYVNAPNFADYPIPHMYYVQAPFNLVQLSNDGSREYLLSTDAYNYIKATTSSWLKEILLEDGLYGGLLTEIELDWINNNYDLTMIKDGVQGIVEYLWRKLISSSHANITHDAVQSLIYNAMKAGFDDVLKNSDSDYYIGSASKRLIQGGTSEYFYTYAWDATGLYRDRAEEGYMWVYANSKWNQLDTSGLTTGATDKTKWKRYKVKGKTYKRYGNKKKNRYLKSQWWKINDVWYWFNADGKSIKGSALNSMYYEYFEDAEIMLDGEQQTIYDILSEVCSNSESQLVGLLNNQMEQYCLNLFENEKLSYPTVKLDINMVDLSQTTEYKDFQSLERIHLGDSVKVFNPRLGIESTVRVIGLTYDVLRKMNTEIQIGVTETSVINLLNNIGKGSDEVRYVAGEGITIENNTISVIPPTKPYLEDVILNGESVVRNHKAYIDLEEMGIGLQWFEEQEESLYGMETQVNSLAENPTFYVDHPVTMHIDNTGLYGSKYNYYFKSMNTDSSVIVCGYQSVKINTMYNPPVYDDGFLVIAKSQELACFEYWNNNTAHQTYEWSSSTEVTQRLDWTTCEGYGMSTTFSYEGETYYAVLSCSDVRAVWTKEYEVDGVVGWNTDYGASGEFDTMADFCKAVLEANISVDKYNGLARDEKLAFFAGAEDENGTNAKVAIWTDGKVKGLVADVQKNGESVVDENGVASIPDSASSIAELTDVELTNLADKEILEYDAVAEKWKNVANSGGGGGNALILDAQIYTTEEKQVGVWIDNKPLYAKSVSTGGSAPSDTTLIQRIVQTGYDTLLYTKLSDSAGSGGYQAYGFSPIIYSEEEREVGVWIDNKPLYQKTVRFGAMPSSGMKTVAHNINDFETMFIANFCASQNGYYTSLPYVLAGSTRGIEAYLTSTTINVAVGQTYGYDDSYVTICYTKTTDVAGSGSYNTLGVPTVHYSTEEQVIGTWIDGSTLYQKTVSTGGSVPSGATLRERITQVGYDTIKYTK